MPVHLVAPSPFTQTCPRPVIFLAGGITGCPDWQAEAVTRMAGLHATVANPRRPEVLPDDPDLNAEQVAWENDLLELADAVLFWFPGGSSLQPIALYELGKIAAGCKPVAVGADPGYSRRADVILQLSHARPGLAVHSTLSATVQDIIGRAIWENSRPVLGRPGRAGDGNPAQLLRKAAVQARELAAAARRDLTVALYWQSYGGSEAQVWHAGFTQGFGGPCGDLAARMHPGAVMAAAELLGLEAARAEKHITLDRPECPHDEPCRCSPAQEWACERCGSWLADDCRCWEAALQLAAAFLGTDQAGRNR